jgi:hypothetical protein
MARHGLNCTMSYTRGGTTHAYRVRAGDLGYGVKMVYGESQARTTRAFYPHRTATEQFSVQVLLKNWDERQDLMAWLSDYAHWALDPNVIQQQFPYLTVEVPRRDFSHHGMPLTGFEWGAHTGMMMFAPVIVFEAAFSPGQTQPPVTSTVINKWAAFASDPSIQYFYPFGTQLDANAVPQDYSQAPVPGSAAPPVPPQIRPPGPSQGG